MDIFKKANNCKATSYDFYDTCVKKTRDRKRDKKMLHKLSRSRLKNDLIKEVGVVNEL